MKLLEVLKKPRKIIFSMGMKGKLAFIPDIPYLKLMFWANTGEHLNLDNPKTYNDKLQWLKINEKILHIQKWSISMRLKNI